MQLYKISFPSHLSKKCYIGITSKTAQERFKEHCSCKNYLISKAIKRHGKENAIITVLAECDDWELLCLAEQEAIEKYKTKTPSGYNLTDGGEGAYGHTVNNETKIILSEKLTNYFSNEENRKKLSISLKNKYKENPCLNIKNSNRKKKLLIDNPSMVNDFVIRIENYRKNNPNYKKNHTEKLKIYYSDDKNKKSASLRNKKRFIDNPNHGALHSEKLKAYWSNSDNKAKQSIKKLEFFKNNPNAKIEQSQRAKQKYIDNPVLKTIHALARATAFCKKAGREFSELPKDYFNAKV